MKKLLIARLYRITTQEEEADFSLLLCLQILSQVSLASSSCKPLDPPRSLFGIEVYLKLEPQTHLLVGSEYHSVQWCLFLIRQV